MKLDKFYILYGAKEIAEKLYNNILSLIKL